MYERGEERGSFSPREVEELLWGELGAVVRAAVISVAPMGARDPEPLIDEVRSDLALKMLSGKFGGHDPRRASFKTYLAAAARNSVRDIARRGRRLSSFEDLADPEAVVDRRRQAGPRPWEDLLREEERLVLEEALGRLAAVDPRGASILRARYFEGRTYEEIAGLLDAASAKTVHLWAHRARLALRRLLAPLLVPGASPESSASAGGERSSAA